MNNTLKHWREAATLILTAGCQHLSAIPKSTPQGPWHNKQKKSSFNYEVLLLQRSQNSGFYSNTFVFPGGLAEPSDFSSDWVKVFERHAQKPNFGLGVVKQPPYTRPPMFITDRTKFGSPIPGEVAFRICAIRETFEESGILLVVPENSSIEDNQNFMAAYEQDGKAIARWREEVQSDPLQFIEMCKELRCVPNIWALQEWANWLTPVPPKNVTHGRCDVAFFICCLPRKPLTVEDQKEMTTFQWWTPKEAVNESQNNVSIPPTQIYELSRLCNFTHLEDLQRFALHRGLEGCERFFPVSIHAKDCIVQTLPGDELYPNDPDVTGQTHKIYSIDRTLEEVCQDGGSLHRMIVVNRVPQFFITAELKYKHVKPQLQQRDNNIEPKGQL
ncbi:acyl-coenzyme A diphosphatase NUDT19-like [Eleutherodactylus coqui]|uniref:acyl-coenzyme A diphosphatase NUDT19-like n=1 Tax=Eleutherodactylus coqui TaxID=57060 RepID=UPI003462845F